MHDNVTISKKQKKHIATWVYLDSPEERSNFPNNKGNSSSLAFQAVYWRCIVVFFESSLRFHANNPEIEHILYTNTSQIPTIDGLDLNQFFKENNIRVVVLKNKYPLPQNYFKSFRNQFFEFSIIDHVAAEMQDHDLFLLLDSDCVFARSFQPLFEAVKQDCAHTMAMDYAENYQIHGISRLQMKELFHELGLPIKETPVYSGGEVLLAKGSFLKTVAKDFPELFEFLMDRNSKGLSKFNEEAHVLSYFYHREGAKIGVLNNEIKRMWTNRNHYRNISKSDTDLTVWHLPNEKPVGFAHSFRQIASGKRFAAYSNQDFQTFLEDTFLKAKNHPIDLIRYTRATLKKALKS